MTEVVKSAATKPGPTTPHYDSFFIGNQWRKPAGDGRLTVVSPSTEEPVGSLPLAAEADIDLAVDLARRAFDHGPWPALSVAERGVYLLRLADELRDRLEPLISLQVSEMGSPESFVRPATTFVISRIAAQIEMAGRVQLREVRQGIAGPVLVMREPIGVVGAIIPWNAPVPLVLTKLVTPLLLGCSVIVKPAEESPLSAYLVGEAVEAAGLPEGTVSIIAAGRDVGERLVTHPDVDKISFTGSTAAGSRIGGLCGENIKSVTLELGGKSAAILLDDVDLDAQMPGILRSAIPNSGQVCHATTRILVPSSRYEEMVEALGDAVSGLAMGDPHDPATEVGPLAAERQRDRVERLISTGVAEGARVVVGGKRPVGQRTGWFVEPTVFADVTNSMTIAREEIFGPVLSVLQYDDDDDAVRLANDSDYGLGGAIFSSDPERAIRLASRLRTGTCAINGAPGGGGGGPFGGYKKSGLGREHDVEGMETYFEVKSVSLPAGYQLD